MKKLALICAVALAMASCSSLKIVDSNAAANAGAAALQALTRLQCRSKRRYRRCAGLDH